MEKQILISVGREFGSGGHKVAASIAEKLGIDYYSRNFLTQMFKDNPETAELVAKYEEKNHIIFSSRHVGRHTNSIEEHLMNMEFDFLRQKADDGESFVVVGRCGDMILGRYPHHISIFILAEHQDKLERVMRREGLDERHALDRMHKMDRYRKNYHNTYSRNKWGRADSYDICINSSLLGIDDTVDVLLSYINKRIEKGNN